MKIVFITDTYLPEINGIVTSIDTFSKELAKRGHKVYIFCPKYNNEKDKPNKNIYIKRSKSFSFITNKATKLAFPSITGLVKDLKKINPDIVHIHTPMNMGVGGLIAAKIAGCKVVQTYHTYIPDFMVYLSPKKIINVSDFYSQMRDLRILKTIINSRTFLALTSPVKKIKLSNSFENEVEEIAQNTKKVTERLSNSIAWNFTKVIYNKSDLVLTPSEALARILRRHRLKPKVEFLSNGINVDAFKKKTSYLRNNKILHVGRLGLEKNVDIIIKAISVCVKTNPGLILEIWGDGPARPELEKLVSKLNLKDNVIFKGFVDYDYKIKNYYDFDFFVTASCIETQGIVLLEAMSVGLPVIGPNILAVPDLISDSINGYLVRPKSYRDMASKITMLNVLSDDGRQKMGEESLSVSSEHDFYKCIDKVEAIYSSLV
jgi:glycosyltransferase involved in cell wall biosynthesis